MSTAALHVPGDELPLLAWHFDPTVALPLAVGGVAYAVAYHSARRAGRRTPATPRLFAYYAGLVALAVALLGPLDHLNGELFAAHMAQHLLLSLAAPPLILLGRPIELLLAALPSALARALLRSTVKRPRARALLSVLAHPLTLFVAYNATLIGWHLPSPYQAAVANEPIHVVEHLSFLASSFLFWWILVSPYPRRLRLSASAAVILLFATWMAGDLLGATLTLAPVLVYPIYAETANPWGLSPLDDQRLGGALMWVSGGVLFAALLIGRLATSLDRRAEGAAAEDVASTADISGGHTAGKESAVV